MINALTTSAKQVAKFFRMIGDAGQRATKLLGHRLGKIVQDKNMTMGMKLEAFQSMLPFIEISASVALIYQEEPRIFRFLAEAISSEHALDNLIDWTKRYIDRLESELIVAKQQVPSWLNFLIPSAHADISNKSKQAFIDALRKILNGVPGVTEKEIAESFNAALNIFLNALKDGRFALKDVKDDMVVLRAFIAAKAIGGENAIRKLAFNKGWTLGLHKDLFPDEAMLKAIAGINIKTLVENGVENAQKGLQRLLGQLDHELGFQVVKGHMAHILVIADMLKRNDITLVGIEVLEQGKNAAVTGAKLPNRRVDLKVKLENGEVVNVELKNFSSDTWQSNLTKLISEKVSDAGAEASEEIVAGQLLSDLVKYIDDGYKGRQIWFTPDIIPGANTATRPLDAATIAAKEDEIVGYIIDLFDKKDGFIAKNYFNLDIANERHLESWMQIRNNLVNALYGKNSEQGKFVRIYPYNNIISVAD